MPELPEVKRFSEQLNDFLSGKKITSFAILGGRFIKKPPDNLNEFVLALPKKVEKVSSHGKFLYFILEDDWSIWNTLGMTGSWSKEKTKFSRLSISTESETIYYQDIRNFGTLKFDNISNLNAKIKTLGPDVLLEEIDPVIFKAKFMNRGKKTLPEILMDQSILAGIGNYIKAEVLYQSKLSPHRLAGTLSDDELSLLYKSIKHVVKESYEKGGTTLKDYFDFNGNYGSYKDHLKVYGKSKDPLGNLVVAEETLDKRTTHWVPTIQK